MFYRFAVVGVFFVSGAAALIYQVSWTRQLGIQLGHTVQSAAIVLAAFFVGNAVGYLLGAGCAKRVPALGAYAVAELIAVCWAFVVPILLRSVEDSELAQSIAQFGAGTRIAVSAVTCFLLLLPATTALGFTLPMMAGAVAGRREGGLDDSVEASRVSLAYAANTAGALVGTLLATFVLLVGAGVVASSYIAAGLSAFCALVAFTLSFARRDGGVRRTFPPPEFTASSRGWYCYWMALAALSGFGTLALEALYTRLFSLVFHNSSYSFGAVVAAFLAALAGGAALAGVLQRRLKPATLASLAAGLGAIAIPTSILMFVGITRLDYFRAGDSFNEYVLAASGLALLVVGPPIVLLGMLLPVVWKAAGHSSTPGEVVGRATAANSLAAALGALAASFLLLPQFGLWNSFTLVAATFMLAAIGTAFANGWRLLPVGGAATFVAVITLAQRLPAEIESSTQPQEEIVRRWNSAYGWIDLVRDRESDTFRVKQNLHYRFGRTGKQRREFRFAQMPLLLHPNPEDTLFLGLGTGLTAGGSIPLDEAKRVVAVELIPEVVEAANSLGEFNYGVTTHPKVEIRVDDARHYLSTTDRSFDVIVSDLFVPWESETGYLYTVEHYRSGRDRLKLGGIYCQWLPLYQLGEREFESIADSFASVFPVVTLWWGDLNASSPVVALIGSEQPIRVDAARLSSRIDALNATNSTLDEAVRSPERLFDNYLGDWYKRAGSPLNTDEHPRVEFLTPISNRDRLMLSDSLLRDYYVRELGRLPFARAELLQNSVPFDPEGTERRGFQSFVLYGGSP